MINSNGDIIKVPITRQFGGFLVVESNREFNGLALLVARTAPSTTRDVFFCYQFAPTPAAAIFVA